MTHAQPITCPFAGFAYIMEMMCKVVAASHNRGLGIPAPLVVLIWKKLRRKAARFAKLAAAFQAGTLPAPADKRRRTPPFPRIPSFLRKQESTIPKPSRPVCPPASPGSST
jgi:hypothetical protein